MAKKTEQKVAETVLQKDQSIVIGGATYQVAPPSIATLILVSELVAQLPPIDPKQESILLESLRVAKDCAVLGEILATLILGAKKSRERSLLQRLLPDRKRKLIRRILHELTPSQISAMLLDRLREIEVSSFFSITASLAEINLLKPTREAGTTAFGR